MGFAQQYTVEVLAKYALKRIIKPFIQIVFTRVDIMDVENSVDNVEKPKKVKLLLKWGFELAIESPFSKGSFYTVKFYKVFM